MVSKRAPKPLRPDAPLALPPAVRALLGAEADALLNALHGPAPVSVRWNPAKAALPQGEAVPWCPAGRYLAERPVFTLDPLLHAGAYYVQEAASMLVGQACAACTELPAAPVALDLCAAPGGKATHLAALLPAHALLIANEPVAARRAVLAENLWKWGRPDVVVTGCDPARFTAMGAFCDLVLVDAPCSGEGMFRKDPFARAQWSEALVEECAARQRDILDAAWAVLRPGGYLIYSTCTWEVRENEDQMRRLLERGAEAVPLPAPPAWGMVRAEPGLRCYPHRVRGEGFCIAVLRKPPAHTGENPPQCRGAAAGTAPQEGPAEWLVPGEQWNFLEADGVLHAVSARWAALVSALRGQLPAVLPGIPAALRKGPRWMPHPALALNAALNPAAFPAIDLDRGEALRYLRGEALPASGAAGVARMRHQGLGLGWGHGAGNRWNNRWPAPWRIRMR